MGPPAQTYASFEGATERCRPGGPRALRPVGCMRLLGNNLHETYCAGAIWQIYFCHVAQPHRSTT
jgi:hypothetical protein